LRIVPSEHPEPSALSPKPEAIMITPQFLRNLKSETPDTKLEICCGSEECSYSRLIDFCITSNSRIESNKNDEEEEGWVDRCSFL
jgi:hypothetical protein